eukprot:7426264-Pyramimonas_sp.AAC.1
MLRHIMGRFCVLLEEPALSAHARACAGLARKPPIHLAIVTWGGGPQLQLRRREKFTPPGFLEDGFRTVEFPAMEIPRA